MPNKRILSVIVACFAFSAGAKVFAGPTYDMLLGGSPNFDGASSNKGVVAVPDLSGNTNLNSSKAASERVAALAADTRTPAVKAAAVVVPNLADTKATEVAAPAPAPQPPSDPLKPIKEFISAAKPTITFGLVGAYIGWAIAGTIAGAMTGGLLFAAFVIFANL